MLPTGREKNARCAAMIANAAMGWWLRAACRACGALDVSGRLDRRAEAFHRPPPTQTAAIERRTFRTRPSSLIEPWEPSGASAPLVRNARSEAGARRGSAAKAKQSRRSCVTQRPNGCAGGRSPKGEDREAQRNENNDRRNRSRGGACFPKARTRRQRRRRGAKEFAQRR